MVVMRVRRVSGGRVAGWGRVIATGGHGHWGARPEVIDVWFDVGWRLSWQRLLCLHLLFDVSDGFDIEGRQRGLDVHWGGEWWDGSWCGGGDGQRLVRD